uniref:Uncharacterized protein n=1 Tax=Ditylenchus dipsaci TaxID=166011 RepID=A0A915E8Z6_9BILA
MLSQLSPMSCSDAFKHILLVLLVTILSQPTVGMNPMGLHQQRRSSSLEELLQHRNIRSFPYSSVSYMRMLPPSSQSQQPINPQLIFSLSPPDLSPVSGPIRTLTGKES